MEEEILINLAVFEKVCHYRHRGKLAGISISVFAGVKNIRISGYISILQNK